MAIPAAEPPVEQCSIIQNQSLSLILLLHSLTPESISNKTPHMQISISVCFPGNLSEERGARNFTDTCLSVQVV